MKQIPILQTLPRYCLQPQTPSTYRIRKEPTESCLSTLEATVAALRQLEPETAGFDQLIRAFDTMIDDQLQHPRQSARLRKRSETHGRRSPSNVPRLLAQEPERLIVVYGEASLDQTNGVRQPVYWVAERLSTGEILECPVQTAPLTTAFLQHMELTSDDFEGAAVDDFRTTWRSFAHEQDVIVAFNSSTLRLLEAIGVPPRRSISLKSVNLGTDTRTLEDTLAALQLQPAAARCRGRSGRRLANAVALTKHLQALCQPSPSPARPAVPR